MNVDASNYEEMRAWLGHLTREIFPDAPLHTDPVLALDGIAAASPAKARKGLEMAIGDLVEMTNGWSEERVSQIDEEFERQGLPTLSEVRVRFSKKVIRIVRRGSINDDVEYYIIKNAVDQYDKGSEPLLELLAAYEARAAR